MAVYPPPNQILSALGIEVAWQGRDDLVGRALVDPSFLGRGATSAGMGALAPIVDLVAGSRLAGATTGDWLATSDLWMHRRAAAGPGPIELTTELVRVGKRSGVASVEVTAGGAPWVSCTVEFARIRREASAHGTKQPSDDGGWVRLGSGPLLDRPIDEACGITAIDGAEGVVEVHRTPFVHNSIDTFQGGVMVLLADAAAVSRFVSSIDPASASAQVVDMQFRFLAQAGEGPATATATVVRTDGLGSTMRVELVDSSDGTVVGLAVCRVEAEQ